MKTLKFTLLLLSTLLILSSCRTEEFQIINPPTENALKADSPVAKLMTRTVLKDGSHDNIVDKASCLSIKLPVTVIVNSKEITIKDDDGFEEIEDIFNLFDDDVDKIEIVYPVTVILSDYSTITVNSDSELEGLMLDCKGENEEDDDIECLDFEYPFTASVFNENNDLILTITLENDEQLYKLIHDLKDYAAVTINFPIKVKLASGSVVTINNLEELKDAIEAVANTCDEDDDNDYDDDDCESCTTNQLKEIFAHCEVWRVDKLEISDVDYTDNYTGASFYFRDNNTVKIIKSSGDVFEGTWEASGEGTELKVTIDVDGFDKFNKTWTLHEISDYQGEVKVDLRLGDDRLRFESFCNNGNTSGDDLSDALTEENSVWVVEKYLDNDVDETSDFAGYEFYFFTSGQVKAKTTTTVDEGMWKSLNEATKFFLEFTTNDVLQELNDDDWKVVSISATQIKLEASSNSGTETDTLIFTKQ
ncbi:hypothetical protein [Tenacibaculum crassostreae]|uniref:hypothetical protein n=1 Tax=Tenacibaculum crassostreae TaxID=502683 RepID=UPI003893C773